MPSVVSVTVLFFVFLKAFISLSDKLHVSNETEYNPGSEEVSDEVVLVMILHLQHRSLSQEKKKNKIKRNNSFFIIYCCIKLQKTIM